MSSWNFPGFPPQCSIPVIHCTSYWYSPVTEIFEKTEKEKRTTLGMVLEMSAHHSKEGVAGLSRSCCGEQEGEKGG